MAIQVIALVNLKGGVGKTTTTINLAASLAHLGQRVLVVDMDPQGNSTHGLGINKYGDTIYESLVNGNPLPIYPSKFGVDVVPNDLRSVNADIALFNKVGRDSKLLRALSGINQYDYILIDCNPALGLLTYNALAATRSVIIPLEPGAFSVIGLAQVHDAIQEVREVNPSLRVMGYLITRANNSESITAEFKGDIMQSLKDRVFKTVIRQNSKIKRSQSEQMPVLFYDRKSSGAIEYLELAKEVMERGKV
jgi:chromosome partitioning protein